MKSFEDLVLSENFDNEFIICRERKDEVNFKVIILTNITDIKIAIKILCTNVSVYKPDFIDDDEIIKYFIEKSYSEVLNETKFRGKEYDNVFEVFQKISINNKIKHELKNNKKRVRKEMVHKKSENNIMISDYYKLENSNMIYVNVFYDTEEICLDHKATDHIEATLLMEISRQGAILSALVAYAGQPKNFLIIKEMRQYKKMVKRDNPCIMQLYTWVPEKDGIGFCTFSIWQSNVCCTVGYYVGYSLTDKSNNIK